MIISKFGNGCIPRLTRKNLLKIPIITMILIIARSNEIDLKFLFFLENNGLFID
jgi:hypothetical protein